MGLPGRRVGSTDDRAPGDGAGAASDVDGGWWAGLVARAFVVLFEGAADGAVAGEAAERLRGNAPNHCADDSSTDGRAWLGPGRFAIIVAVHARTQRVGVCALVVLIGGAWFVLGCGQLGFDPADAGPDALLDGAPDDAPVDVASDVPFDSLVLVDTGPDGAVRLDAGVMVDASDPTDAGDDVAVMVDAGTDAFMASCFDGMLSPGEAAIDCGGACAPCSLGSRCDVAADCASGACTATHCAPSACANGVMDGAETDVDCGGACAPCNACIPEAGATGDCRCGMSWYGGTSLSDFDSIAAVGDDVWIGGRQGRVARWDGREWFHYFVDALPGVGQSVEAIDGLSETDVWLVKDRGLYRFDGSTIARIGAAPVDVLDLEVVSPTDAWAITPAGTFRWQGASWALEGGLPALAAVDSADGDVWFVGAAGAVRRHDGTGFTTVDLGVSADLTDVAVRAAGDAFVVGLRDELLHYRLGVTEVHVFPGSDMRAKRLAANASVVDVSSFRGLLRWNGTAFVAGGGPTPTPIVATTDSGTGVVANRGLVWAFDGSRGYDPLAPSARITSGRNGEVWFSSEVGFGNGLFRWNGTEIVAVADPGVSSVWSLWVGGPGNAWVGGRNALFQWDGSGWTTHRDTSRPTIVLGGTSANDVWVRDRSTPGLSHWDGAIWTDHAPTVDVVDLWGLTPNDAWAVTPTSLLHWDGVSWTADALTPGSTFVSVWASGPTDVWVAERFPSVVHHFDGTVWEQRPTTGSTKLIRGAGTEVWLLGDGSGREVRRWDGATWELQGNGACGFEQIEDIAVVSDRMWATGFYGRIWSRAL